MPTTSSAREQRDERGGGSRSRREERGPRRERSATERGDRGHDAVAHASRVRSRRECRPMRSSHPERHRGHDPVLEGQVIGRDELGLDRVRARAQRRQRVVEPERHGDELRRRPRRGCGRDRGRGGRRPAWAARGGRRRAACTTVDVAAGHRVGSGRGDLRGSRRVDGPGRTRSVDGDELGRQLRSTSATRRPARRSAAAAEHALDRATSRPEHRIRRTCGRCRGDEREP